MSYITRSRVLHSTLNRTLPNVRPQPTGPVIQIRHAHEGYYTSEGSSIRNNVNRQGRRISNPSGSKLHKQQFSTTRTFFAEKKPKSTEGLEPKILNEQAPTGDEESKEVKQHNKEFENRAERAHESLANEDTEKDKVSSKFWSEDANDKTGGRSKENA